MKALKSVALFLFVFFLSSRAFALTASYDQKISMGGNLLATIKVSTKEKLIKAESDFSGMKTVMLRNKAGMFSYLPSQKVATKIPPAMDRPNVTRDIPQYLQFLNQNGGKKIGAETVAGRECDIYSFTEPNVKKPGKAWIWREKQFPVKIEVQAPEGLTTIEMENINFNVNLKDSDFELPSDVKVLDLPAPKS